MSPNTGNCLGFVPPSSRCRRATSPLVRARVLPVGKDICAAVREICAALPDVEEHHGIGMADFRVAGKTFATLAW